MYSQRRIISFFCPVPFSHLYPPFFFWTELLKHKKQRSFHRKESSFCGGGFLALVVFRFLLRTKDPTGFVVAVAFFFLLSREMRHRFADVADALANAGFDIVAPPFVLNVDDQRDLLRGATLGDFAAVHASPTMLEHRKRLDPSLCIVRAFVPHVSEHSTSWLTRPKWSANVTATRLLLEQLEDMLEAANLTDLIFAAYLCTWLCTWIVGSAVHTARAREEDLDTRSTYFVRLIAELVAAVVIPLLLWRIGRNRAVTATRLLLEQMEDMLEAANLTDLAAFWSTCLCTWIVPWIVGSAVHTARARTAELVAAVVIPLLLWRIGRNRARLRKGRNRGEARALQDRIDAWVETQRFHFQHGPATDAHDEYAGFIRLPFAGRMTRRMLVLRMMSQRGPAGSRDKSATAASLAVRRSLSCRARLRRVEAEGDAGMRRMTEELAGFPGIPGRRRMTLTAVSSAVDALKLCDTWERVEALRLRAEKHTAHHDDFLDKGDAGWFATGGRPLEGFRLWCVAAWETSAFWQWQQWVAIDKNLYRRFCYLAAMDFCALDDWVSFHIPAYEALVGTWPTLRRCDPVMSDVECAICWGGNADCALGRLDCGHIFGRACLARWFHTLDESGLHRTCPLCSRLPLNADVGCFQCHTTGHHVQLHNLGCSCGAVFCLNCAPLRSDPCPSCGSHAL